MESKNMTTADDANWRAACEAEVEAREAWAGRWGWIRKEYQEMNRQLEDLKARRPQRDECRPLRDSRTVRPFPVTTARDIGWLSGRKEFQLEVLGPYPYTARDRPPILPPGL